jgi:hypothetical protein
MKDERNIDDLFRSSFEDFEIAPPASVKNEIDRKIDGKRSSRKFFWWFFALLLLVSAGTFAGFFYSSSNSANDRRIANTISSDPADGTSGQQSSDPSVGNEGNDESPTAGSGQAAIIKDGTAVSTASSGQPEAATQVRSQKRIAGSASAPSAAAKKKAGKKHTRPSGKTSKAKTRTKTEDNSPLTTAGGIPVPAGSTGSVTPAGKTDPAGQVNPAGMVDAGKNPESTGSSPASPPLATGTQKQDSILAQQQKQKKDSTERANDSSNDNKVNPIFAK